LIIYNLIISNKSTYDQTQPLSHHRQCNWPFT